ncbi:tRNA1(Val) (adenine(37)-N6)-methyltransferase [Pedobacter metabolipauper]|uniref:tRNA1(Val) (adenine(37)-N6)-methyltransferase n=1 Tax=Pedobacter metabolipauper TaxID=425513 RepID=A0A4R6SS73_9SPHI|nr:methyltransferase [Pedobacter metabolipauper]TDQ08137.1 tRNA1Val (adenine37-N6)-methyltransferase [Pedobacter metabolipauper]
MGSIFKFKQFEVSQSGCAMKINTDGVILGAIAQQDSPLRVLDVGTGTGVIAMMLAQRFPAAVIDAVEIDESAASAAAFNFNNSKFADRLKASHGDIGSYEPGRKYDLIVSNPPYFVNDLKNPEKRKQLARHADELFFEILVKKIAELLTENGKAWLILPVKQAEYVVKQAREYGLSLCRQINVCSDEQKPIIRHIICLSALEQRYKSEMFYIYQDQGVYTQAYKTLLKDFFLAF